MNIHDLESTLQEHGNIVKNHISPPFSIESQPLRAKPRVSVCRTLAIVAAIVLTLSVGAYAIHQLWDADEVAAYFDRPKLAEAFAAQENKPHTVEDGDYRITLIGYMSGINLDTKPKESTSIIVAVEYADGTLIDRDNCYEVADEIFITPYVAGYGPYELNIHTLSGGGSYTVKDGVLYFLISCPNIERYGNTCYIAVGDHDGFLYDEKTGLYSVDETYDGINVLFEVDGNFGTLDPDEL